MGEQENGHELAVRAVAAVLAGGVSLLGPDAGAAATALVPAVEAALARVAAAAGQRRFRHAAETVADAAEASGLPVEKLLEQSRTPSSRQCAAPRRQRQSPTPSHPPVASC